MSDTEEGPLNAVAAVARDMDELLTRLDADEYKQRYALGGWPDHFDPRQPYLVTHALDTTDEVLLRYLARAGVVRYFVRRGVGTIWQRTGR